VSDGRRTLRRGDAEPRGGHQVQPLLLEGRHVLRDLQAFGGAHAEQLQLPVAKARQRLRHAVEEQVDALTHQVLMDLAG